VFYRIKVSGFVLSVLQFEDAIRRRRIDIAILINYDRIYHHRAKQAVVDLSPGLAAIERDVRAADCACVYFVRVIRINCKRVDEEIAQTIIAGLP